MKKAIAVLAVAAVGALATSALAVDRHGQAGQRCIKFGGAQPLPETDSLDPTQMGRGQIWTAYDSLVRLDDQLLPHPMLATSWKSNKKATVWTFTLRRGVKFHDGHQLTSADVVYTYKRLLDPKTGYPGASSLSFLSPTGILAPAKYTVRFVTKRPVAELPRLIAPKGAEIVARGATRDQMLKGDAGTGPFTAVNYQPRVTPQKFVKFAGYWQKGEPKAACVEFYAIPEEASRTAALRSGQIDINESVGLSTLPELQGDKSIRLLESPPGLSMTLAMWVDTPPFNDVRVREALKKVVDRRQMIKTVFLGHAVVGDDNPIPPTWPEAWRKTVPGPDIQGAEKLLAAAGYGPSHPLTVDLYTADTLPNSVNMAQLYKLMAAKAGITVNVQVTPPSEFYDKVWLHQPFVTSGWNPRSPGEAFGIEFAGAWNETHWHNAQWSALVQKAIATIDPRKRVALYRRAEQIITQQGGEIIPAFLTYVVAERSTCTGYHPATYLDFTDLRTTTCSG